MAVGCRHGTKNMKFTRERWTLLIEGVAQLLILQKRLLGENAQLFSRFRQRDGAVIANKQRLTEILFEALDLPGKRGGTDVHGPRAAAKMAAFRQMQKGFQIA